MAIVIPTYKDKINNNELISLKQCRKVLKGYDRYFIVPNGSKIDYAEDEIIISVDKQYFLSRNSYSKYVLSLDFYGLFSQYEYILIYQLDAFIFRDDLKKFCDFGFDYYGALWPQGLECHTSNGDFWYKANGGFSLRKVKSFINWINDNKEIVDYGKMILPEDLVIAIYGSECLQIADEQILNQFAYELNAEETYLNNNSSLPFGCHGWTRFSRLFWKRIIDSFGYDVEFEMREDNETHSLEASKLHKEMWNKFFDKRKIYNCLNKIISKFEGDLYVFGAGLYGYSFVNMVKNTNINVLGIIDNDQNKSGKRIENIPIISFEDYIKSNKKPVLIALENAEKVENQFRQAGFISGLDFSISKNLQKEMCK